MRYFFSFLLILIDATMHKVEQIESSEVPSLRKLLTATRFPDFVANSNDFQTNYGALFQPALQIWNRNFNSNNILAAGHNPRFVLNVKYKSIEFKNSQRNTNWGNLKRARVLYL